MKKLLGILTLSLLLLSVCQAANKAVLLELSGAIGPAAQDYITRAIDNANKNKANIIILQLNTPGGLETSMRGMNQAILNSSIPVVVYVAPAGARAASAGTFILYASHIAAMAPGTNVGAASPVSVAGAPSPAKETEKDKKTTDTHLAKATNDAVTYIRSLAQLRDRNIEWAEKAVREAVSLSAQDALKLKVINVIAKDVPNLLTQLQDYPVKIGDKIEKLQTTHIEVESIKPDWRVEFLSIITDPNVAYILLLLGIYGLFFELANPGFILPGVVGTISILLALYAFQLLPISYAGLTLILVGLGFMVAEAFITSFGVLGVGGMIAFIAGSIMLLDTNIPEFNIAWSIIIAMSVITAIFFFLIISMAFSSYKKKIVSGRESLVGTQGEVVGVNSEYILVRVQGEIWNAVCDAEVKQGDKIRVIKVENLVLHVELIKET